MGAWSTPAFKVGVCFGLHFQINLFFHQTIGLQMESCDNVILYIRWTYCTSYNLTPIKEFGDAKYGHIRPNGNIILHVDMYSSSNHHGTPKDIGYIGGAIIHPTIHISGNIIMGAWSTPAFKVGKTPYNDKNYYMDYRIYFIREFGTAYYDTNSNTYREHG